MNVIFKMLLAILAGLLCCILIDIPDYIGENKKEKKKLRKKGCYCPYGWFGQISVSPECPVHKNQCTISHYNNWYGKDYVEFPHTTVERIMICQECFDKFSEERMEMFYYKGTGRCGICNRTNQLCIRVPANLVNDWIKGEVFHFSPWNEKKGNE